MLKIGQYLPLDSKTAQHFVSVCAPLEYFDRDALFKLSVGAFGEINGSHAAAPEFFDNRVRTHSLADSIAFVAPEACRCDLCEFFENIGILGEQLLSFTQECGVTGARLFERCRTLFRRGMLQHVGKNTLEPLPACWI
jgi:hypothetical protein